jgi:RNA polymerase sigma factor (sigma-70 family)
MTDRLLATVRRWAARDGDPDAELLRRFATDRDEAAFEQLVSRHGGLVWAVCRRMLRAAPDADDAFQATFLALVRSAPRLRVDRTLGGWLHGVAVRVCLNVRRGDARRSAREQLAARPEAVADGTAWDDVHAAVHAEVENLPPALREAFVLCELQGVRQTEAATQLGWKLGTLSGRLTKARQRLLKRLTDRGITPAVAAGVMSVGGAAAGCPARLALEVLGSGPRGSGVSGVVANLARGATEGTMAKAKVYLGAALAAGVLASAAGWLPTATAQFAERPVVGQPLPGALGLPALPAGPGGPNLSGKTWEYLYVGQPEKAGELPGVLRKYGENGWELTTVLALGKDGVKEAAKADPERFVVTSSTTAVMVMKRAVNVGGPVIAVPGVPLVPGVQGGVIELRRAEPGIPAVPAVPVVPPGGVRPGGGPQG